MEEMTLEQQRALALAQARLRAQQTPEPAAPAAPAQPAAPWYSRLGSSILDRVMEQTADTRDVAAGALRGAGSIGSTLLAPVDIANDLLSGRGVSLESNMNRRAAIDSALQSLLGARTDSAGYQIGKIGGEVAGTAGVGGLMGRAAQALGMGPAITQSLATSGMASTAANPAANLAARIGGGAATGAAAAGLINPQEAATGAAIGGALPVAQSAARVGMAAGRQILGNTTGVGAEPLRIAYESGRAGGTRAQSFVENMRGNATMDEVLDTARQNLSTMRQQRAALYRQNMAQIKTDQTVLDLAPIEQSVQDAIQKFTFKGQAKNPRVLDALQKVGAQVEEWKQLDPAQFHTAEGLDALKQRIGSVMETIPFEERAVRSAVKDVYQATWKQIQNQAPTYARTMRSYEEASSLIDEISRSLSLGERATADTAMRKLQSVMRNNVNANYGVRLQSARALEDQGGREIFPALAGQSLNEWTPRGLQRAAALPTSLLAGAAGGPLAATAAAAGASPRLMGEAAYALGRVDPILELIRNATARTAPVLGAQ